MLFRGTERFALGRDRPAVRRHGRRAERRHRQGVHDRLRADARPAPAARLRRDGRHGLAARLQATSTPSARSCSRRSRCTRTTRRTRSSTCSATLDLRRSPAGAADHRPRAGHPRDAGRARSPPSTRAATCRLRSSIAAAGSVDHDAIVELAEQTLGGLRAGERAPAARPGARSCRRRACASSARTPSRSTSASAAPGSRAATSGASPSACSTRSSAGSRPRGCSRAVREERGLAYAVYSFAGQFTDTGQVGLYVGTRPDNLAEAMEVVEAELERLRERAGDRGGARPRARERQGARGARDGVLRARA